MSRSIAGKIKINTFADLCGVSGESVVRIAINELWDFKDHPFHVCDDEEMEKLAKSIEESDIIVPLTVRARESGGYEIISGHRRKHAALKAGKKDVPAVIKNISDDEAVIAMVDSNIQREEILPSERAFSYKMKLKAIKNQGRRSDLTSVQIEQKLDARKQVAMDAGESEAQVQRYIRLTNLIEWMIDRYQVKTDKASGITNDPNEYSDDPVYIAKLIPKLVTVSMRTVEIIENLPPLDELTQPENYPEEWKVDNAKTDDM